MAQLVVLAATTTVTSKRPGSDWWLPPLLHKIHKRLSLASSLTLAHSLPPGVTEVPPGDCAGPPGLRRDPALWPAALLHLWELHPVSHRRCLLHPPLLIQVSSPLSAAASSQPCLLPVPSLPLPLPAVYWGLRTHGYGSPKPASGLGHMLHGSSYVFPSWKCIIALGDLPLGYLDKRLYWHQVTHATTGWRPIVLYEAVLLALHAEAFKCCREHRQASWKEPEHTVNPGTKHTWGRRVYVTILGDVLALVW